MEQIGENGDMVKNSPYYLFDANRFKQNINFLKGKLSSRIKVCFSVKSNPFLAVFGAKYADYVEVCSEGEYQLCTSKIKSESIIAGGVYKSPEWLKTLARSNVARISLESISQLGQLEKEAEAAGTVKKVLLRLSSNNQFGMAAEEIVEVSTHSNRYPHLQFCGIHYYSGTQKNNPEKLREDLSRVQEVLRQSGFADPCIEYGPGIGVFLYGDSKNQSYQVIYEVMIREVNQLAEQYPITLELGRVLTADVGKYVTTVVDRKRINDRTFYIVDGGIHHLSYYAQQNGFPLPAIQSFRKNEQETVTVCGSLCTASDVLAKDITLPRAEIGDRIAFLNVGAYSVTEARALFLSHRLPEVWIVEDDKEYKVRDNRETYQFNTI